MPEINHLKSRYQKTSTAQKYVAKRFTDRIWQLEHARQAKIINREFKKTRPFLVLDLASGPARISRDLKYFKKGIAADISQAMLTEGQKYLDRKNWTTKKVNAFKLPFADNYFNAVVSFRFIRHFRKTDREKLLAEINRVLKPNGILIFDALNKKMQQNAYIKNFTVAFKPEAQGFFDALWTTQKLKTELKANKFVLKKTFSLLNHLNLYVKLQKILPSALLPGVLLISDKIKTQHNFEWIVICQKV